jgi:hypothetical protein
MLVRKGEDGKLAISEQDQIHSACSELAIPVFDATEKSNN